MNKSQEKGRSQKNGNSHRDIRQKGLLKGLKSKVVHKLTATRELKLSTHQTTVFMLSVYQ